MQILIIPLVESHAYVFCAQADGAGAEDWNIVLGLLLSMSAILSSPECRPTTLCKQYVSH